MKQKVKVRKHWIVLLCLTLMFAAHAGIINNSIGVFYSPVSESLGIMRGSFALHSTLTMIASGVISLAIPQLMEKFGWKKILIFGTLLGFIGTAGMAFTESLSVFYLLGIVRGIGSGLFGLIPIIIIINKWFHKKNGVAISITSAFSGLIGMIFAPLFASVIDSFSWETGFILMGIAVVLFALPAIIYPYHMDPESNGLAPYGYKKNDNKNESDKHGDSKKDRSLKTIYISFIALTLFSIIFTNIIGMNQHLSSYGETIGMSLQTSGYMLSAVMFGNFTFKLLVGYLSDRLGAGRSTVIMMMINMVGLIIFITSEARMLNILAAFLFGSVFGIGSVALPLLSNQFFGRVLSGRVYPKLTFIGSFGIAFANTFVGFIYDFTGSYEAIFLIALVFQGINFGLLYIAYKYSLQNKLKNG